MKNSKKGQMLCMSLLTAKCLGYRIRGCLNCQSGYVAEREEFGDCLNEIKENRKVSEQHTFVSKEVSERAHHGKSGCPT